MSDRSIITEWEAHCASLGQTIGDGLRELNDATGYRLEHSQWSRIRRGRRALPATVHRYMARVLCEGIWHQAAAIEDPDEALDYLADGFSPPPPA